MNSPAGISISFIPIVFVCLLGTFTWATSDDFSGVSVSLVIRQLVP